MTHNPAPGTTVRDGTAGVLTGLRVLDLSWGTAGPVTSMLLGDDGADVVRVVPPAGDPFAAIPWSVPWGRSKRTMTLDLGTADGRDALGALAAHADVLLESFAPGTTTRLGISYADLAPSCPRLVYTSITGYGRRGALAARPGHDALVAARTGFQWEQPGWRPGPVHLAVPLPSYGAALLAMCGITAALRAREHTGRGQWVETSLLQGVLAWTTMPWTRVERPSPGYDATYRCRGVSPTPCYEAGDGRWMHPMPDAVPLALQELGVDPASVGGNATGTCDERKAYQRAVQELFMQRPRDEWLELFWSHDVRCQPVQSVEEALDDAQARANGILHDIDVDGIGTMRQFASTYRLEHHGGGSPRRPAATTVDDVRAEWTARPAETSTPARALEGTGPLAGVTVLDFGLAVAGPYAPMLMSDLGADVIRVDNVNAPRATDNQVWAACQRGKRSITLDLKSPEGREVVRRLVARADVIHHNMRPGVAERLGIGYGDVSSSHPRLVYCHVTGFGPDGPLATFPGSDQMAQALMGLDHEQGATPSGGRPTWYRVGMCDHTAAILSVIATIEALYERERTGRGQLVETNIVNAAALLMSHMYVAADARRAPALPRLDVAQTGFGPRYRLYECADGWVFVSCPREEEWRALADVLGAPRVPEVAGGEPGDAADVARLEAAFRARPAAEWVATLDAAGVPCEQVSDSFATEWFDDPDLIANGWVARYTHPRWGTTEQLGLLVDLSDTPGRLAGPPVVHGQHSREILAELGYPPDAVDELVARGITSAPDDLPEGTTR